MSRICIIPARGGSKRFPKKNVADFFGRPLFTRAIDAALNSQAFDNVVLSTDDSETIGLTKLHYRDESVVIDNRLPHLASDEASVLDVCLNFLRQMSQKKHEVEFLCCLYPTAALRDTSDIISVCRPVFDGITPFAMAVTKFDYLPTQALIKTADGLQPYWPNEILKKSQDTPEFLVDNGSTYCVRVSDFIEQKTFYGKGLLGYEMPRWKSVDIDYPEDLELVKLFFEWNYK